MSEGMAIYNMDVRNDLQTTNNRMAMNEAKQSKELAAILKLPAWNIHTAHTIKNTTAKTACLSHVNHRSRPCFMINAYSGRTSAVKAIPKRSEAATKTVEAMPSSTTMYRSMADQRAHGRARSLASCPCVAAMPGLPMADMNRTADKAPDVRRCKDPVSRAVMYGLALDSSPVSGSRDVITWPAPRSTWVYHRLNRARQI